MSGTITVFYGGVVNPESLTAYAALPRCLLAVGASGNIEWVVEEVAAHELQDTLALKGCIDADIIELKDGEFLMPGFVDTHTVSLGIIHGHTGNSYTHPSP
jgi:guanine deaminase